MFYIKNQALETGVDLKIPHPLINELTYSRAVSACSHPMEKKDPCARWANLHTGGKYRLARAQDGRIRSRDGTGYGMGGWSGSETVTAPATCGMSPCLSWRPRGCGLCGDR